MREFRSPKDGEPRGPGGPRVLRVPAPGQGFERTQVRITDGEFTIDATKGETRYRLTGTVEEGKASPSSIRVGEKSYKSVDDVPEEHRAAVKQLLGSVGGDR